MPSTNEADRKRESQRKTITDEVSQASEHDADDDAASSATFGRTLSTTPPPTKRKRDDDDDALIAGIEAERADISKKMKQLLQQLAIRSAAREAISETSEVKIQEAVVSLQETITSTDPLVTVAATNRLAFLRLEATEAAKTSLQIELNQAMELYALTQADHKATCRMFDIVCDQREDTNKRARRG